MLSKKIIQVLPQQGCLHRWGGHLQQVCLPAPSDWNEATIRWDCLQSLKWSKQTMQTIPPDGCQGGICWRSQPGVFQDAAPQGTFLLQHEISQGLHIPYPKKYTRDQGVHCSPTRVDRYLCQWGLVGPGVDCGKNEMKSLFKSTERDVKWSHGSQKASFGAFRWSVLW